MSGAVASSTERRLSPRGLYRRSRALREAARERRFRPRLRFDPQGPELLLSPHLDDAVLDCWSLLASDRDVRVVNLFTGVPAAGRLAQWDAITGARDSSERVRARVAEDARALGQAGRSPVNLPFLDAQYRRPPPAPSLDELDLALSSVTGGASRVHVPAGLGGHPDHLLTRRYGRCVLRTGLPVSAYAELPYCALHGWPVGWTAASRTPTAMSMRSGCRSCGACPSCPRCAPPAWSGSTMTWRPQSSRRWRCYDTQLPCLDYAASGVLSDPAIHRYEVSWGLVRPPRGP